MQTHTSPHKTAERFSSIQSQTIARFHQINRNHVLFHTLFGIGLFLEVLCFSLFFAVLAQTTWIAVYMAAIFLTIFTYLVLLFYQQTRRPEKLQNLRDFFVGTCKSQSPFAPDSPERHTQTATAILHLIDDMRLAPLTIHWINRSATLHELVEKFRVWTQWKDLLKFKELLLFSAIREHIDLIKKDPSELSIHSSLANCYLALSQLYQDPRKLLKNDALVWTPPEYESPILRQRFEITLNRALEEYQIIDGYAPENPWVCAARAAIYHELGQTDKELQEYEMILRLDPSNTEVLIRVGVLYFKKGMNASGLKIYDQLKTAHPEKADELISHYGSYSIEQY